jgi:hypothetical protein
MLTDAFARDFAADWIAAWNSHDLSRVLSHYTDDFEMSSPFIPRFAGEPSGVLQGKPAIAAYWRTALDHIPDLHFNLHHIALGAQSIVLIYDRDGKITAESFYFNAQGLVYRAAGHYVVG